MEFYSNHDIWLVTAQIVIERRTTGRQMRMIYTEEVFEMRGRMWRRRRRRGRRKQGWWSVGGDEEKGRDQEFVSDLSTW